MPQNKPGSPMGAFIVGLFFLGAASLWKSTFGTTMQDQLYLGFFQFMGGMSMLGGVAGMYWRWRRRRDRSAAAQPSDTHGKAAFATLAQCADAGLTDPHGLYLGQLGGTPLFYKRGVHVSAVTTIFSYLTQGKQRLTRRSGPSGRKL